MNVEIVDLADIAGKVDLFLGRKNIRSLEKFERLPQYTESVKGSPRALMSLRFGEKLTDGVSIIDNSIKYLILDEESDLLSPLEIKFIEYPIRGTFVDGEKIHQTFVRGRVCATQIVVACSDLLEGYIPLECTDRYGNEFQYRKYDTSKEPRMKSVREELQTLSKMRRYPRID